MNNGKLEAIKGILVGEYAGDMPEAMINAFADDLYHSLFVGQYSLDDIPAIIGEYESEANVYDVAFNYLFGQLIDLLDNNEATAKRLYDNFMYEFESLDVLAKLVNENAEYLTAEQLARAKEKAFGLYDSITLECYGITE
ncbi:MAG: hypothetical protein K2J16_05605 [Clostridia bacterium]|nr:hypothetical protein [Clostridia bacterium]